MAKDMSELVINEGFKNVDEVWGTEIGLIAPGLYAGTTDCIGMHKGEEAIIDFKTIITLIVTITLIPKPEAQNEKRT